MNTPVITWNPPSTIYFGAPLSSTELNATANVAGFFEYTPASGTILSRGNGQILSCIFYPSDSSYSNGVATTTIDVLPATPSIVWTPPASITVGTALSATQLNAVISPTIPGFMQYTPVLGTILPVGNTTIHVVFTPVDNNDYNTAIADVVITVVDQLSSLTVVPIVNNIQLGETQQLIVYGNYLSGTVVNLTNQVVFSSSNSYTVISSTGLISTTAVGISTITCSVGGISTSFDLTVLIGGSVASDVNPNFYKSHVTQDLLNYFDSKDLRVRNHPYTIDAQLLSLPAMGLDNLELRLYREQNRNLQAPCNIDNGGVYYGYTNNNVDLSNVSLVTGIVNSTQVVFTEYDDTLPIPASITINSIGPQSLPNSIFTQFVGTGDIVLTNMVGTLPIPGKLNFFLDKVLSQVNAIDIAITGYTYPQPLWQQYTQQITESLTITTPGQAKSLYNWQSITSITVRNLLVGSTITGYVLPFQAPMELDPHRYYTDPSLRSIKNKRYWNLDTVNHLIYETWIPNPIAGFDYVQSYKFTQGIVDIAVEPFTYGMYAVNNNTLFYMDRREPMPGGMIETAINVDPTYGLLVNYDGGNPGIFNSVIVTPVFYPNSIYGFQYRIIMEDPTGLMTVLLPNGSNAAYSQTNGWRTGTPTSVNTTLGLTGTYIFSIESQNTFGTVSIDSYQYGNYAFTPLATIDLSFISTNIKGIAFDEYQKLWIYDGVVAYPLDIVYNGYVVDPTSNILYLTLNASSVAVT